MNAITLLEPAFQWWERFSDANPGIGMMAFFYGAVLVLVWMFSRFQPTKVEPDHTFIIVIGSAMRPPLPPLICGERDSFPPDDDDDDDSDSFAE